MMVLGLILLRSLSTRNRPIATAIPPMLTSAVPSQAHEVRPEELRAWRLLFVRDKSIWIANGDGSSQKLLIRDAVSPCWSPDRTYIAFARHGNLWTSKADGSQQNQLTHLRNLSQQAIEDSREYSSGADIALSWCPALKVIDFSHWEQFEVIRSSDHRKEAVKACSLFEIPADKPGPEEMISRFDMFDDGARFHTSDNSNPAWSPDGKAMAFTRNGDIWLAKRSAKLGEVQYLPRTSDRFGWDVSRLASPADYDAPTYRGSRENYFVTHLSWAPDGKQLAYSLRRVNGSGYSEIYVLPIDKSIANGEPCHISTDLLLPEDPCFSPDGRFLACRADGGSDSEDWGIYVIDLTTGATRLLARNAEQPAW